MPTRLERLWRRVDARVDTAATPEDLYSHRLDLLAAERLRRVGRPVPATFVDAERFAAVAALSAPVVLRQVAEAVRETAILIKGPEVAAYYPDPALRSFWDIDVLVADPDATQARLLDAGFVPVGDPAIFVDIHHLRPLQPPGMAIVVEVHSTPKWPDGLRPPAFEDLARSTTPSALAVDGIQTLEPAEHALVLAAHSWAHEPLRRLRDLVDIAIIAEQTDRATVAARARDWGIGRLWQTTIAAVDALFFDGPEPRVFRAWAQNLALVRERTVIEHHTERLFGDFWARPFLAALGRLPGNVWYDVRPDATEDTRSRLARARLALRNASRRRSVQQREWALHRGDREDSSPPN